jgi:hypothetical protein
MITKVPAIRWQDVKATLDGKTGLAQTILQDMQEKLTDPAWLRNWRSGPKDNPRFAFTYPGTLTEGDKKEIVDAYLAAGWGSVVCSNSEDNGERPGMCGVTIQRLGPLEPWTTSD